MPNELDTAVGASVGSLLQWRRKTGHELPLGSPCANCGTPLQGPWCHACGQLGEDFHRSAGKLVVEAVEGLFHFDGRLWTTLPDLALHPGRLTKRYLEGHRAPQIPPLRLFLVVLLLVFLVGSLPNKSFSPVNLGNVSDEKGHAASVKAVTPEQIDAMTPDQKAKAKQALTHVSVKLGSDKSDAAATNWLQQRMAKVIDDPELFKTILESWGERFAFLMLPLSTLLLAVAFAFRRGVFLFDHVIFSLHSLSFMGLLMSLAMITPFDLGQYLLLAAPVHLFVHLRGVYATSIIGTLLRMLWLFVASLIGVVFIMLGLVAVGLNAMH